MVVGFAGEQLVGWPRRLYHPIMAIGALISKAEKLLRAVFSKSRAGERAAGILMALTLPLISLGLTGGLLYVLYRWSWIAGFLVESAMCWSIFASGSLRDAAGEVGIALSESLDAGRKAVAMIVGRDTERLTEEGVIKATVETVAENLSDGVIAPLVFTALGGAAGGYFYKTVNTMDSMVGYRNDRYRYFGTGAARLDDVCNFLPARLTALLMILLSGVCGLDRRGGGCFAGTGTAMPAPTPPRRSLPWLGLWGSSWGETPGILANCTKRRPSATACGRWNLPTFPVRSC